MNDKSAKKEAAQIRADFWESFDRALGPDHASKRAYLDELEELASDADGRIDCVRDEIAAEEPE